jgi:hypothetical protein
MTVPNQQRFPFAQPNRSHSSEVENLGSVSQPVFGVDGSSASDYQHSARGRADSNGGTSSILSPDSRSPSETTHVQPAVQCPVCDGAAHAVSRRCAEPDHQCGECGQEFSIHDPRVKAAGGHAPC